MFFAKRKKTFFRSTKKKIVVYLIRHNRCMVHRTLKLFDREVRDSDIADLSLALKFFNCIESLFYGNVFVPPVYLVKIKIVDLKFYETVFEGSTNSLGTHVLTHLACNEQFIPVVFLNNLSNPFFA